jgi:hypothetical protein
MRYTILLGVMLASLGVGPVSAGDLPRAYFEATEPGSWARYETSVPGGGKNATTYTRLADEGGAFVVEIVTEFLAGPGAGGSSTSIFTLTPEFDWKRRFLSFGKELTAATFVMEGRPPMPQPEQMVAAMRESMADFAGGFDATGTATRGGVECDVYTFHAVLGGPNSGTMDGEVCLSAAVPFGVVHETATSRNEKSGESSFETLLVGSGSGPARAAPVLAAARPPEPTAKRMNIALAYQRGAIALDFRVRANTGGRVFEVALTNLGVEPLVIGVGTSTYAFEVGPPIGTLFFQPVYEQDVELAPGETSGEFHAAQNESRGVREGSFRLVMKRGVPTLTGDVKVGKVR